MANPTLKQVAAAAGVHHTTISRALRGHPGIPARRAAELRALADRMGYVPDPMMRALAAYRTARRPAAFHSTLVWLTPETTPGGWRRNLTFRTFFNAISQRARELGFQLEEIPLPGADAAASQLNSILAARNTSGVIVGPAPAPHFGLEMIRWDTVSAVRIGLTLGSPLLHAVSSDQAENLFMIMRELQARGYRRPGLFVSRELDERVNWRYSSAFLGAQFRFCSPRNRIPPGLFPSVHTDMHELVAWVKKHRPDAVIALGEPALLPALRQIGGWRVPEDIGLASIGQPDEGELLSGIAENNVEIGRTTVNQLVAMINRQERGIPLCPQILRIAPLWVEAGTLRPRKDTRHI